MLTDFIGRLYASFIENNGFAMMVEGLGNTLMLALSSLVLGITLGTLFAVMQILPGKTLLGFICNAVAKVYITVIRGIPLMVLLLLGYFGIMDPMGVPPMIAGIIIFGINSGAYVAEIIRSGIQSVDIGQMEAGRSLGLPYGAAMMRIVLPQAIKNILPALGNEFIVLIKETSVASFITIVELTRVARSIVSRTYDVFVPYLVLAAFYVVLVILATFLVNRFERWMRRSDKR